MDKNHKSDPHPAPAKKALPPATADELHNALEAMVIAAEASGQRDNPEVAAAREIMQRHGKRQQPE